MADICERDDPFDPSSASFTVSASNLAERLCSRSRRMNTANSLAKKSSLIIEEY